MKRNIPTLPSPDDERVGRQSEPDRFVLDKLDGRLDEGLWRITAVVPEGAAALDPAFGHVVGAAGEELARVPG